MHSRKKRRGRPTRAEATAKALAALGGVDPATIHPRMILASIAADTSAPATARVAACRALLASDTEASARRDTSAGDEMDPVSTRAIALLADRAGRSH